MEEGVKHKEKQRFTRLSGERGCKKCDSTRAQGSMLVDNAVATNNSWPPGNERWPGVRESAPSKEIRGNGGNGEVQLGMTIWCPHKR